MASRKPMSQSAAALKHGWRSGLEEAIGDALKRLKVAFEYESFSIPYIPPQEKKKYTPDFLLPNGIIVESKGRWVTADRKKMKIVKEQHPDLDIRFVFSNPNQRISKLSKTTYGMWAEKHGFPYAKLHIPNEWLREPTNEKSLAAVKRLKESK